EHDHQHLEQHEHGLEQSAAVCRHLARGAQALEFTFQRVELYLLTVAMIDASPGSGRVLVLGLDRHHGRQHREAFRPRQCP
ncbi:hypothetical protein, partial [Thiolapillus sp.]|uniref:hypothetical protein n=1 Tax=Thiolapillus sp. TaxID=2017437 RepID=UPI0025ED5D7E